VTLKNGSQLVGKVKKGLRTFYNIPFGEAPVGDKRFRPVGLRDAWTGVRDCSGKHGKASFQVGLGLKDFINGLIDGLGGNACKAWMTKKLISLILASPPSDEDCLNLWIQAPVNANKAPVMVWIHGGDFQDGCGGDAMFGSGAIPLENDVVCVYLNYRLNIFGFFAHPELARETDGGIPWGGDAAVCDWILGLQWVQQNIEAFGGDPGNITIYGESAGGEAVLLLMSAPDAKGLFHRAVAQSPGCGGKYLRRTESSIKASPS
jgi:para-nitrobenzyl esterase